MQLLSRALQLIGPLSVVVLPMAAWTLGWHVAIGLAGGILWALANAWTIGKLVKPLVSLQHRRWWKTMGLFILKIPVLYAIGAVLLLSPWSSPLGFVAGFSLWFVVLCLSALRGAAA